MIYATGDTHGNFQRFAPEHFPEQAGMTKEDYMIICGDFGGVWDGGKKEERNLDWLEDLPFTTLFISGNHENFDLLRKYPTEEWNGGKIQRIRPHVIHLMRGQVFDLQGYFFFAMGGARSHDIEDGVLNPKAPDFEEQYWTLRRMGGRFRVNHQSWWKQELPSKTEYEEARHSLEGIHYEMDYVITHCAPTSIVDILGNGGYVHDHLTDFLEEVKERAKFHYWLFGHYHDNKIIDDRFVLLWEQMIKFIVKMGGKVKGQGGFCFMSERENIVRLWFNMWLTQQDLGIDSIFAEDVVYTESWCPQYSDRETVKHWFEEWNTRGKVLAWDIKQFFHQGNQTVVVWYFKNQMDNGKIEEFDGISLIEWTQDDKIKTLKEFGCNLNNYNPYQNGDTPEFRNEKTNWF